MRYLKEYKKELVIFIAVLLFSVLILIWAVSAAIRGELTYQHIIALAGDVFALFGLYTNMPTSEANAEHTHLMRLEKLKRDLEYGYFEVEDDTEDEDEDEVEDGEEDPDE